MEGINEHHLQDYLVSGRIRLQTVETCSGISLFWRTMLLGLLLGGGLVRSLYDATRRVTVGFLKVGISREWTRSSSDASFSSISQQKRSAVLQNVRQCNPFTRTLIHEALDSTFAVSKRISLLWRVRFYEFRDSPASCRFYAGESTT